MKIIKLDSYESLSEEAGSLILKEIKQNKNALLCAATGGSPTGTYGLLRQSFDLQPDFFSHLRVIKLDEWGGVPMTSPFTCEYYLRTQLTGPLRIDNDRYIAFHSNPRDPLAECDRIQRELNDAGQIDICILGLGMNGHLALNEPGEFLEAGVHIAKLSEISLQHPMINEMHVKPSYGLTLGMGDILQSAFILLLISGAKKKKVTSELLNRKISTALPASLLWLHPNVVCLIEQESYP
jgi:galactosamine-6-phosphate isomerase